MPGTSGVSRDADLAIELAVGDDALGRSRRVGAAVREEGREHVVERVADPRVEEGLAFGRQPGALEGVVDAARDRGPGVDDHAVEVEEDRFE